MSVEILKRAYDLIKAGNQSEAGKMLAELVKREPKNKDAWLMLSSCVKGIEQKQYCLNRVLQIDPSDERAQRALNHLLDPEYSPKNSIDDQIDGPLFENESDTTDGLVDDGSKIDKVKSEGNRIVQLIVGIWQESKVKWLLIFGGLALIWIFIWAVSAALAGSAFSFFW